ncbi:MULTISPECIES: shikimate kinase [unclassified Cellulophaga]|uniref:shikimate kinase n=1 Tax=unclassified Cellulophaga TaxID=2634405 RepID=UPI0026E442B0|nr:MULTISPECIES: shikimate kinase [unclassified Cellulophaga]MDO6493012.1 shikimate kinase [Cellulophaga sp. 2_MG-2023]MDO6495988.1 shikimate kinase [Cellulophaga sp. 3_MG-2023]
MQIVLIGYMGSGKSTIGKELSKRLKINFLDLDSYIEQKYEMTISELFTAKGEIFFRKAEIVCLNEIFASKEDFVLSTGGGTPCYGDNIKVMTSNTNNVFYLNVPIPELIKRLVKEKEQRPLIANVPENELPEFIGTHLFERSYFYTKAHHTILVQQKEALKVVDEIVEKLV